jgi:hypothetical protein
MGLIRSAFKGLGKTGRNLVAPKSKAPRGGRKRGVNRGRRMMSIHKKEKKRLEK